MSSRHGRHFINLCCYIWNKMALTFSHLVSCLIILIGYVGTVAADYCNRFYDDCAYGCCDNECCSSPVALIVGLCVGGGVFIFFVILIICLCRRRRTRGIVYQNHGAPPMIIHSTTHGGVVNTAGVQPGVTYNQYQQPYGPYPNAPPTSQPGYQAYPPQPQPYGHYASAPVHDSYAAAPPSYDSIAPQGTGGVPNPGYDNK